MDLSVRTLKIASILILFLAANVYARPPLAVDDFAWIHLYTLNGDLPVPGPGKQQTATLFWVVNGSRDNSFV